MNPGSRGLGFGDWDLGFRGLGFKFEAQINIHRNSYRQTKCLGRNVP